MLKYIDRSLEIDPGWDDDSSLFGNFTHPSPSWGHLAAGYVELGVAQESWLRGRHCWSGKTGNEDGEHLEEAPEGAHGRQKNHHFVASLWLFGWVEMPMIYLHCRGGSLQWAYKRLVNGWCIMDCNFPYFLPKSQKTYWILTSLEYLKTNWCFEKGQRIYIHFFWVSSHSSHSKGEYLTSPGVGGSGFWLRFSSRNGSHVDEEPWLVLRNFPQKTNGWNLMLVLGGVSWQCHMGRWSYLYGSQKVVHWESVGNESTRLIWQQETMGFWEFQRHLISLTNTNIRAAFPSCHLLLTSIVVFSFKP